MDKEKNDDLTPEEEPKNLSEQTESGVAKEDVTEEADLESNSNEEEESDAKEELNGSSEVVDNISDSVKDEANEVAVEPAKTETTEEETTEDKTIDDAIKDSKTRQSDIFQPDPEIDAAVDDIVRTESDEVIAETDAKLATLNETKNKKNWKQKVKGFFVRWWKHKPARYGTLAGIGVLFVALTLIPTTRYSMLNTMGVRVKSSMRVIDAQTRLPLRNINVNLQDKQGQTDELGEIVFEDLKLGKSNLLITKIGYADNNRDIVLGWGSNPIGDQGIVATGEQFIFVLSDWKSGEPIVDAEATSGENSAVADDEGKVTLTVGQENILEAEIIISADGYREEAFSINELNEKETKVEMVPAKRHAFISNRDGQFDLYTVYADGEGEKLLLEATGSEREVPTILAHPTRNLIGLISSRDGDQNQDGFILDGLFVVDTETGEYDRIARSEQIQTIGWHEDRIVFWQVVEGTSRGNPERSKLISYHTETKERLELAAANYFNDVRLINGVVYYAVSGFAVPQSQAKLYSVSPDGGSASKLIDNQVYNIFRVGYNSLVFSAEDQKWFGLTINEQVEDIDPQAQPANRRFSNSPNGERTAWVEVRDGRGVLLIANTEEPENETQVVSLPGLESVQYWINDATLVFRVIRTGETADYVVYVDDPAEEKITDITASTRF